MGSLLQFNDTLQMITTEQGFRKQTFDLERHREMPITAEDVSSRTSNGSSRHQPTRT